MMWWNGEPLPIPSPGISFEERIVEGTNSGQTLGGTYSKKIIARKEDVRVTWEGLTAEESAVIGKIDASTYGIRVVPDNETAYAASGKNAGTLHIEVCYSKAGGEFETASISALRELVQYLMKKYNIPAGNVLRHYDLTGKYCPWYYVDENRWAVLHEYITSAAVKPKKLYRVQVGAFSSRENAEQYMNKVKAAGFGAFIMEVDKNA